MTTEDPGAAPTEGAAKKAPAAKKADHSFSSGATSVSSRQALTGRPDSPNIVVRTGGGHSIVLSDLPGGPGITLKHASGAKLEINDSGITIDNGKGAVISLSATQVDVNNGALTVK